MSNDAVSKIIAEYEKTLYIPDNKPFRQYILCPVGLPGSGKTTVINALCRELFLVRISSDDIGDISHNLELPIDLEVLAKIVETLFRKYLDLGHSIVLDTDCATPSNQELLRNKKDAYNLQLIWIHINPPEKFIMDVGLRNKPRWLFKDINEAIEIYQRRKKLHENLSMPFVYVFDTSLPNLNQQISEASKLINKLISSY